jgi:hypothetical protein
MTTCKIQWIDKRGNPTPDNNMAIGVAWVERHWVDYPAAINGGWWMEESEKFPICAEHARRLPLPYWNFKAAKQG